MTQKYKKNNSPAIQNGIFSGFPDVFWFRLKDLCQKFAHKSFTGQQ